MNEEYVIGIDLGTTNSCIGIWKNGKAEIITNENGERITPSYVCLLSNKRLICNPAKKNIVKNPENRIYDVKRMIGREYSDKNIQKRYKIMAI